MNQVDKEYLKRNIQLNKIRIQEGDLDILYRMTSIAKMEELIVETRSQIEWSKKEQKILKDQMEKDKVLLKQLENEDGQADKQSTA